ncbi:MAG: nitroreductase family protein [Sandaracinaceae bacterium]
MSAPPDALHDLLRTRRSPIAFSDREVTLAELTVLLEAARWAPSCFNGQPWRFLVARRADADEFGRMLSCLNDRNQRWARAASVLMITATAETFADGRPNRHARHDVGLAVAQLTVQANALGIGVHQMAGFSSDRARELYAIPDGFDPVTAVAIGYPGDPATLEDDLRERAQKPRTRRPLSEIAFEGAFGTALGSEDP